MEKAIIIRYCEIHLKGKNRGHFEKLLKENVQKSLKGINHTFTVMHSRYLIENFDESDYEIITEKLRKIAGVHNYSLAYVVANDFEEILKAAEKICEGKKGTFRVTTNRADKTFKPDSMETSMLLGGRLLEKYGNNIKVDVKNPDFTVFVDIREDRKTFVYSETVSCMSGMPVGSAGKGLLLISGGIDSPVAGYMMCKRGMKIECLHFHSFPYTGEAAKEKVKDLTKIVGEYNGGITLHVVSFTHIQEEIHKKCPEEYMITIMRRFMMRIAERMANQRGAQAIITGESLGQVASQTIESITSSNSVVTMPVLRPLIGFDKLDIIDISKKIEAYETSILPYEDCCTVFLPKFPLIKPNLQKVIYTESKLDVESLIEEAMSNIETYTF
ncbi:MAG: tRNA uracil 4-sulfurtransferase ThiI [Candidatus Borkfalkiaceae bacterium]|nr:tRNA uracil 4-sulfurtransferase ThiI [Christensenellaceae bacterium]